MNIEIILSELNRPEVLSNFNRRVILCSAALQLVSRREDPLLWAQLQDDLGNALRRCQASGGDKKYEQAVSAHRASLEVYTRGRYPREWARAQNGLGLALMELNENRPENIELAIEAFRATLSVRTYTELPFEWTITQNNLANAFGERIRGSKKENLLAALAIYDEILSLADLQHRGTETYQAAQNNREMIDTRLRTRNEQENERIEMQKAAKADTTMRVVNIFDLMKMGRFVEWQNCRHLRNTADSRIILMVSHRWNGQNHPDPTGIQYHGVVRFIIQACMMAMGSTPNVFNNVDCSDVILSPTLLRQLLLLHEEYNEELMAGPTRLMERLAEHIQLLAYYLDNAIGRENSVIVAMDIPALAYMMRHFDIWYDYVSLPQQPRQAEEQRLFNEELHKLDYYFAKYHSVILWSRKDIKRAWCFLEAMISWKHKKHSIFSSENSLLSSTLVSPIYQLRYDITRLSIGDKSLEFSDINAEIRKRFEEKDRLERAILMAFKREKKERINLSNDLSMMLADFLNRTHSELN
ncbi:MAG: hypothetical protein WCC12_17580, partial [Anaerolineales bacterium]